MQGVIDQPVSEHFTVYDTTGGLIIGIDSSSFIAYVHNPSGTDVSGTIAGSFIELGNGNYKYVFTPNVAGTWYVNVVHPVYFPWGKNDDIQVYNSDLNMIYDTVIRTLGLSHHNIFIDNTVFDENGNMTSARLRIYSDSISVGTNTNVIETYLITADGTECGKFNYWSQVSI